MGRPKGSKNKKPRAKARSKYEAYEYWYDQYTKGKLTKKGKYTNAHKAGWFRPKLNQQELEDMYDLAKRAGVKNNIAKTIARSQEYVDRKFEKRYKDLYGKNLPDISDKKAREQVFLDFVGKLTAKGMSYDDARDEFEKYFY